MDIETLRGWIGRTETCDDTVMPGPAAALAATLDRDDPTPRPGEALPPLWHWLYFLPAVRQSELGPDGHPRRGGFLPPVPLPRRMWAGGRLRFERPLRIGEPARRTSTIANIALKQGRTGPLIFVSVQHRISDANGVTIIEDQDLVYRDPPTPGKPAAAPADTPGIPEYSREVVADEVLLFRYSALTFNSHRIHYDQPYATRVEGYPALVVHGPLLATLLADLVRRHRPERRLSMFSFRAIRPVFAGKPFEVCGAGDNPIRLWIRDSDGSMAMEAQAETA